MDKSVSHVLQMVSVQFHDTFDRPVGVAEVAEVAEVEEEVVAVEAVVEAVVEEAVEAQALEP